MLTHKMPIEFRLGAPNTNITVGNDKYKWEAEWAGELADIGGFIQALGSGAGTKTTIMLRNETTGHDMLSTGGSFEVDSATGLLEGAVVNPNYAAFAQGDIICLDVDAVSTNPQNGTVTAYMTIMDDDV